MLDVNLHPFPHLTTARLVLRQPNEDDLNALFYLRNDEVVTRYTDTKRAESVEQVGNWLKGVKQYHTDNEAVLWAICLNDNPQLIGTICYWRLDKPNHRAEIGYALNPEYHGQGIMHEAMLQVIAYGFNEMKLHSIEANVNPANEASIKLLQRCSFEREAYFKQNYFFNGTFLDTAVYSLLTPNL